MLFVNHNEICKKIIKVDIMMRKDHYEKYIIYIEMKIHKNMCNIEILLIILLIVNLLLS